MLSNAQTFSGMELDRAGPLRKDARWVVDRLRDPASRFVAANATGVVLGGEPAALVRYPLGGLTDMDLEAGAAILLDSSGIRLCSPWTSKVSRRGSRPNLQPMGGSPVCGMRVRCWAGARPDSLPI